MISKYKAEVSSKFRSRLEEYAAKKLEEAGIAFEYEPYKITLFPSFKTKTISIEKKRKVLSIVSPDIRAITYTPDFVGKDWIVETKGMRTAEFDLKWKMLKSVLKRTYLYMPTNQKEVDTVVGSILQNHEPYKRVLPIAKDIKLPSRSRTKPKVLQIQTGKS